MLKTSNAKFHLRSQPSPLKSFFLFGQVLPLKCFFSQGPPPPLTSSRCLLHQPTALMQYFLSPTPYCPFLFLLLCFSPLITPIPLLLPLSPLLPSKHILLALDCNQLIVWFTSDTHPNLEFKSLKFWEWKNKISATADMFFFS